jgi:hypothetical protein
MGAVMTSKRTAKTRCLAAAAAMIIGLSGCSSLSSAEVDNAIQETPELQQVENLNELRLAFEDAGGSCDQWEQTNAVIGSSESATCDGQTVLSVYSTSSLAIEAASSLRDLTIQFGLTPSLLLGDNWLINSPDVQLVRETIGGTLIVDGTTALGDDVGQATSTLTPEARYESVDDACTAFLGAARYLKGVNALIAAQANGQIGSAAPAFESDEEIVRQLALDFGDQRIRELTNGLADSYKEMALVLYSQPDTWPEALDPISFALSKLSAYCGTDF